MRTTPVILAFTTAVVAQTAAAATWTAVNTGIPSSPVHVNTLIGSPASSSVLYASARRTDGSAALFKSTDAAGNWRPLSGPGNVYSLVADPRDPSTVYVLAGQRLLKSSDGGTTWAASMSGIPNVYFQSLVIDPVTSTTLYVIANGNSLFKSIDGGATWNQLTALPPTNYIGSLVLDPLHPASIYAIASVNNPGAPPTTVLIGTTDGGQSWSKIDPHLPANTTLRSLSISASAPSRYYAVTTIGAPGGPQSTGIFSSSDGAQSWTPLSTGLPAGATITSLSLDAHNSSIIYVLALFPFAEAGGILKSTDAGAHWTTIDTALPANTVIESLLVDATNSSTLYVIVDGAILKSTNGGANWSKAAAGLTATDVQAVAAGANDPASIFIGAGNRILKSGDAGATWIGLSSLQYFTAPGSVAVGSFFPNNSPAFPRVLLLDFTNPNVLFTGTTRGNGCYFADNLIYKSTDGGVNWSGSASPNDSGCVLDGGFGPSAGLKAMDPTDPNTLYLAEADDGDGDWALLKSQDGGASWNSLGFPAEQQAGVWAVAIDPGNPATLYAGLDDYPQYQDDGSNVPGMGGVFKSTDGGATWNSIGLSGAVNVLALDPTHPSVVYAATEGNYSAPQGFRGLFKTNDGGASWTSINNGLASLLGVGSVTSMAIDPANFNAVYIGTSGNGIFKSSDGGATWGPFNDGLANFEVHGLAIAAGAGHTVYAATSGGVFKVIDAAP